LLVEYYSDYFDENSLEAYRQADGEIQLTDTGDELIDKWEALLAEGKVPDLYEAFSKEGLEHLRNLKRSGKSSAHEKMKRSMEPLNIPNAPPSPTEDTTNVTYGWDPSSIFAEEDDS